MSRQPAAEAPCLVVDCGPDSELWRDAYVPALGAVLGLPERDLTRLNLGDAARDDTPVTVADLDRIVRAPYLIVDTSSQNARTYLMLGYALANRKRIIHVHSSRTPDGPPVAGTLPRTYADAGELGDYLRQVVGYVSSVATPAGTSELQDFLPRCGFPLTVLEGDGRYGYALPERHGDRPIHVNLTEERYAPPEPWRSEFARVHKQQVEYAASVGSVLFNGDLIRLLDHTPQRDERLGTRGIRIDGQLTDYFTFASSNHCWDFIGLERAAQLREVESRDLGNLRQSVLANPLTVSVSVVLRDADREWLLIQRRNRDKNFHGKQDFTCAAAGMVSATRDQRSGEIDVYATACNELREETGVRVREEQIVFLALLRENRLREVGLVAEVALRADPTEIIGPRADSFESKGFLRCEATPEAFAEFLAGNLPLSRFAPLSAGAILFSLLRRFSRERVEAAFSRFRNVNDGV